ARPDHDAGLPRPERSGQSRRVVFGGVRMHDHIDAAHAEVLQVRGEPACTDVKVIVDRATWAASAVDQRRAPPRRADQNGIALSDVDEGDLDDAERAPEKGKPGRAAQ